MATLVSIDVINKTIPSLDNENIPIINKPNPCYGYLANAKEVKQLIQMPNYWIYEAGTNIVISGKNYYEYFPEEELGGGITKEEVQVMINESKPVVDSVVSTTSTNAIQNSTITNFVNSSISTNTANYVGQFNSIEELNAYTGTLTNNDYAFVVGEDESGNTKYDRHKWVDASSEWLLEYTLNNSSFTAEEWASIQSGVKAQDVTQINTNKSDISTLSTTKADKTELVGKNVTGTKYTIDGKDYTAQSGAEIFNNYTDNKAVGIYSHAEGFRTTASGSYSHAEGMDTTASGYQSHAEGYNTKATGRESHAEGETAIASGTASHAEGFRTIASDSYSHAEGMDTTASGYNSHAEGSGTTALGMNSHAEGSNTKASSANQHVQGKYNVEDTEGKYAFIIGNGKWSTSEVRSNAFAIDWNGLLYVNNAETGVDLNNLVGKSTTGEKCTIQGTEYTAGVGAEIFNDYSNAHAVGAYSHAEGAGNSVGSYSHAEGGGTLASGSQSHAEGSGTTASGPNSHAEGGGCIASGYQSHAEGSYTKASSENQHVQGKYNIEDTEGKYAFIIGNGTSDTERSNAFAIDWNGLIYQNDSTDGVDITRLVGKNLTGNTYVIDEVEYPAGTGAEIFNDYENNKAVGRFSHAEGSGTIAINSCSHAEGYLTKASAFSPHAEGRETSALGDYSHAEGYFTKTTKSCAHAEGRSTIAASTYQHVQGKYNIEDSESKYAFIIGNGTSDTDRSNAFAIDWEGKIWQGNSSIGVQVSQNVDLTLEEYEALSDEEKNNGTYYNIIES